MVNFDHRVKPPLTQEEIMEKLRPPAPEAPMTSEPMPEPVTNPLEEHWVEQRELAINAMSHATREMVHGHDLAALQNAINIVEWRRGL